MGVQAQSAEEDLNGAVKKAESLLKLAEMCRRLETEQVRFSSHLYSACAVNTPRCYISICLVRHPLWLCIDFGGFTDFATATATVSTVLGVFLPVLA